MEKKNVTQPQDKYIVRLPDGLRERIRQSAEAHKRSMNSEIIERLLESLDGRVPSEEAQKMITDLQGRLAIMTTMANVRLQTIETFIQHLTNSEEAREKLWSAIRRGEFNNPDMLQEK